jgi:DNA-directed RNA polymerase specialized sigma24 family protein
MTTSTPASKTALDDLEFEQSWNTLYPVLLPLAKRWVNGANIYSWKGQEYDIAWDIVLVTIQRTYEYNLKAQRENKAIGSFQKLSIRIAKNYFLDLRRKDSRILPLNRDGCSQVEYSIHDETNVSEVIEDRVYEEWLFQEIAKKVVKFSTKLRKALLIDLATHMDFDTQPTPLQAAFLNVGIQLQEYAGLMPQEHILRSRHASLVSLGYRQLKMLFRNCCTGDFATSALGI